MHMDNKYHKIARILTLIPLIVFAVTVICMIVATVLEVPTARGTVYSFFALIGILNILFSHLPCLLVSVAGTVFAAKSVKQGYAPSRKFLALGIVEILACIVGVILAILMLIGGMSV